MHETLYYYIFKDDLPIELFTFTPADINWKKKHIRGMRRKKGQWKKQKFRFPDAVYNRCYHKNPRLIRRLEKYIGSRKCFNRYTRFDKWTIHKILFKTGLNKHLPETCLYTPSQLNNRLLKEKKVIVKPRYGGLGDGVYVVASTENKYKIYYNTWLGEQVFHNPFSFYTTLHQLKGREQYLIQNMLRMSKLDGRVIDMRILVQKNKNKQWTMTKGVSRVAHHHSFITNLSQEIWDLKEILTTLFDDPLKRSVVSQNIKKVSIEIAKTLDEKIGLLGELGIDLAIDEEGKIGIIEVNGRSQKGFYHQVKGKDCENIELIYRRPLEYAYVLAKS